MSLPLKVRNALRMGNSVAAQFSASCPEGAAWVWVKPVMRSGKTFAQVYSEWTRMHEAKETYDDVVEKYRVRILELSSWTEEELEKYDVDSLERTNAIRDEWTELYDEAALEKFLMKYISDLSELRHPLSVDYYF